MQNLLTTSNLHSPEKMTQPKFIITMNGYLRMGMVNQHKELLKFTDRLRGNDCIGGGYYHDDFHVSDELMIEYY